MSCACSKLPQLVRIDARCDLPERLEESELRSWIKLSRCRICGQYWRVDEWDKFHTQFAVKINDPAHWQEYDDLPLRKKFLLESRGGITNEKCIWQGCTNNRVKGVVLCIDHLFQTGARE